MTMRVWLPLIFLWACGPKEVGSLGAPVVDAGPQQEDAGEDPNAYPDGPYGITAGEILRNMTFAGYVNALPEDGFVGDRDYQEVVTMQDIRALDYDYVLFNVAAIWCVSCQVEAQELPEDFEKWAPRGGLVMSVLKEDAVFNPATKQHLDQWLSLYSSNYTMLHDPNGEIDAVLAPSALPLNVMVDLETMEILRIRQGDDPEFFAFFESRLR